MEREWVFEDAADWAAHDPRPLVDTARDSFGWIEGGSKLSGFSFSFSFFSFFLFCLLVGLSCLACGYLVE